MQVWSQIFLIWFLTAVPKLYISLIDTSQKKRKILAAN